MLFDAESCTEVEEPVGTLEVSCWSEAYSGFCVGLSGFSWKGFLVCLVVCAEFDFVVFVEINGDSCHKRPRRDHAEHTAVYCERVEPKNCIF